MKSTTLVAAALAGASGVSAFWRMPCRSRTGLARMDPIMDPGAVSDHVHAIHGSGNFGMSCSAEELNDSDCTSCGVTQDKSAYWTPSMYFVYNNGSSVMIDQVGGMLAYYLMYLDNLEPFPEGFQMVAGNRHQRNFTGPFPDAPLSSWPTAPTDQFFLQQRALGFNCLNYDKDPEPSLYRHQFPSKDYMDANCKDGIRMEMAFPSCGNGKTDSPDHQSHMAYPSLVKEGNCPDGFDHHYPFLFFETIWATEKFSGEDGYYAFSMGDPVGTGYHGDFMMGWESSEFLGKAIKECTNMSGRIEDCPIFDLQSDSDAAKCTFPVPEELQHDDPSGWNMGLPVDVPMQWGPECATKYAVAGAGNVPTTSLKATKPATHSHTRDLSYTAADSSATKSAQGGIIVAAETSASAPAYGENKAAPAPTEAPVASEASDEKIIATSYITKGNEVIEMFIEEVDVTVTASSPAASAHGDWKRHHARHAHGHAHHH